LRAISRTGEFRVALLHGVTGSGKTEILPPARRRDPRLRPPRADARPRNRALTPAVAALFRQAFGERVAIQHSGLVRRRTARSVATHPPRRHRRRGSARSAVFAPLERVGLIVVDEEHDGS
jgi:primosomal protein N' (replication factor Y)